MDKHAKRSSLLHYPVLIVFTLFFVGLFALDLITPDRALSYVCDPMSLQILRNLPGTHDGSKYGTGYAAGII